jgi:hypothetical protein
MLLRDCGLYSITFMTMLLSRDGITQGVPCTATIFWSIVRSTPKFHSFLIHPSRLSGSNHQRHLVANQVKIWLEIDVNFADGVSLSYSTGFLTRHKPCDMRPTALLPLRKESCYGLLSPLKIHRPRPGLNPQILGPMASPITTRWPRPTEHIYKKTLYLKGLLFIPQRDGVRSSYYRQATVLYERNASKRDCWYLLFDQYPAQYLK